jgi:hypothetical protein
MKKPAPQSAAYRRKTQEKLRFACQDRPFCGGVIVGSGDRCLRVPVLILGIGFPMGRRETRLVLVGVCGVLAALVSNCALGSIIVDRPAAEEFSHPDGMLDASQGMAPAAPVLPPDKGGDPLTIHPIEGLAPAGTSAGPPNSVSQGGGNGSSNAAMAGVLPSLPEPALQTSLPRKARPIMPTGPPFELLRPPRAFAAV